MSQLSEEQQERVKQIRARAALTDHSLRALINSGNVDELAKRIESALLNKDIQATPERAPVFNCSCGATCSEEEYKEHVRKGHDAPYRQSFEEAQLEKIYEDPHPGFDCAGTCVIHSGRFPLISKPASAAPVVENVGLNLLRQLVGGKNSLRTLGVFSCNQAEHEDVDCECFWEQCEAWARQDAGVAPVDQLVCAKCGKPREGVTAESFLCRYCFSTESSVITAAATAAPQQLDARPSCWHCGVILAEVPKLRCEECPIECDVVNCNAYGCAERLANQHLDSWK